MIDYAMLHHALGYYTAQCSVNCDFKRVRVPWSVGLEAINVTAPIWAKLYQYPAEKYLVASGEQGLMQLLLNESLEPGRYSCITPCFRDEEEDDLHKPYFMKVELFDNADVSLKNLQSVMDAALWWFKHVPKISCELVATTAPGWDVTSSPGTTYDIVDTQHGIELGSYGIREHSKVGSWIYGTGHAEPRASYVKAMQQQGQ